MITVVPHASLNTFFLSHVHHFFATKCLQFDRGYYLAQLRDGFKKNPDYLVTLIKRVGGYLAEITTS